MAHIANKIHAEDKALEAIFTNSRYRIESFQREYRWQRKQIEALISDLATNFLLNYTESDSIEDVGNYNCYYMGPIVVCEEKNELSIVDGQQRLTSFSLLFIYLQHLQKTVLTEELCVDLTNYLFVSRAGKKTLTLNVPTREDVIRQLLYKGGIAVNSQDFLQFYEGNDESLMNVCGRYEDICTLFPEELKRDHVLPLFVEWLQRNVIFVKIMAYSIDNAYSIFETMNDRGLNVNPTEILKAYLLSKIENEEKGEEMNRFWKERIADIKYWGGATADESFLRAWLRAKYAITTRSKTSGAENEDFELIGTQFNAWIKAKSKSLGLKESIDFYNFVKSDFSFFSDIYLMLMRFQRECNDEKSMPFYLTAQFPLADSLYLPIIMSPLRKTDSAEVVYRKMLLVTKFVDCYSNRRFLWNKSITQSSIRDAIYSIIKEIRDIDVEELELKLNSYKIAMFGEMDKENYIAQYSSMYSHFFFTRVLYQINSQIDYAYLQRSRKHNSLRIQMIFTTEEYQKIFGEKYLYGSEYNLPNLCLVHRSDDLRTIPFEERISYIRLKGYVPEMDVFMGSFPVDFINMRMEILKQYVDKIWSIG